MRKASGNSSHPLDLHWLILLLKTSHVNMCCLTLAIFSSTRCQMQVLDTATTGAEGREAYRLKVKVGMDSLPCLGLSVLASGLLGLARIKHFLLLGCFCGDIFRAILSTVSLMREDEPLFTLVPNGTFLHLCESAFTSSLSVLKSLHWPCSHLRLD